jgi:hypothetical protein
MYYNCMLSNATFALRASDPTPRHHHKYAINPMQ